MIEALDIPLVDKDVKGSHMDVKRTGIILQPSNTRVVIRPFQPASDERVLKIIARVLALSECQVKKLIEEVVREFIDRHQGTRAFFLRRFEQVKQHLLTDHGLSEDRRMLIGSYFSQEYASSRPRFLIRRWFGIPTNRTSKKARAASSSVCGRPAKGICRRLRFDRA